MGSLTYPLVPGLASRDELGRVDTLVDLGHLIQVLLGLLQLAAALGVRRLPELLDNVLKGVVVVLPLHVIPVYPVDRAGVCHWHGLGRLAAAGG